MLLLTTDNRFFHCNLISKKTEYLFCKQEKNIEQIWLYNHRIGFNTKNTQNKTTITIIPLAFFYIKIMQKKYFLLQVLINNIKLNSQWFDTK